MHEDNQTLQLCAGSQQSVCSASRLWRVTVEYTLLVVAETEREAETEAEYYAGENGGEADMSIAHVVRTIEDVPNEWRNSIPFGGDRKDGRTCWERVTPNDQAHRLPPTATVERRGNCEIEEKA